MKNQNLKAVLAKGLVAVVAVIFLSVNAQAQDGKMSKMDHKKMSKMNHKKGKMSHDKMEKMDKMEKKGSPDKM